MKYKTDIIAPELFILVSIFIGTTLRTHWLTTKPYYTTLKSEVLYNIEHIDLTFPLLLLNLFSISYITGKILFRKKIISNYNFPKYRYLFSYTKLNSFIIFSAIVSIVGTYYLLSYTSAIDILTQNFSDKRRLFDNSGQALTYSWIRVFMRFSKYAFFLGVFFIINRNFKNLKFIHIATFLSLLIALVNAVIISSRTEILYMFLGFFILLVFNNKKINYSIFGLFIIISVYMSSFLIQNRGLNSNESTENPFVSSIIANNNFLDVVKTGIIADYSLRNNKYYYGSTYISAIYSLIPRQFWKNKPPVYTGVLVRKEIMPTASYLIGGAVPPGFVGEAFLNFGYIGLVFLSILWSVFLTYIHSFVRRINFRENSRDYEPFFLIFLMILILELSFKLAGGSMTQSILPILEAFVVWKIVKFIGVYEIKKL